MPVSFPLILFPFLSFSCFFSFFISPLNNCQTFFSSFAFFRRIPRICVLFPEKSCFHRLTPAIEKIPYFARNTLFFICFQVMLGFCL